MTHSIASNPAPPESEGVRPEESKLDIEKQEKDDFSISHSGDSPNTSRETLETGEIREYNEGKDEPVTRVASNVVNRVLSRISTKKSWVDPGPPPDGGLKAWTQCGVGVAVVTTTWGFVNSFGVFQQFYVGYLDRPPSDIAWIGSLQVFLLFLIGTFTGRLADAGYLREVFALGSLLQLLGIFMASISTKYWHFLLAQGICVGLGNGCLFCPAVALTSTYFSTKKSLAIGISACGSAIGGLIFPVMVQKLLPQIGFGWTMRCLGLVDGMLLLAVNLFARQRVPPRKGGQILDLDSFKDMTYTLYAIGMFFTFWGVYFAFFYISAFGRDVVGFQQGESINLILVLNGLGIVGRVVPNYLADRYFGPLNLMLIASLLCSVIVYCMIAVETHPGIYVWAVAYGLTGAAVQSLFPAILGSLTKNDLSKAGVRIGMVFSIVSFAVLSGPPIAGALIVKANGGYVYAQCFAATSILIGCGLMTAARLCSTGKIFKVKI